jgi:hypothetical protein
MIPTEIGCSSYRVVHCTSEDDHPSLKNNLDLLEETCLIAVIRNEAYQCRTTCYHYVRVNNIIFKLKDLVLRKLKATHNRESRGKLILEKGWSLQNHKDSKGQYPPSPRYEGKKSSLRVALRSFEIVS